MFFVVPDFAAETNEMTVERIDGVDVAGIPLSQIKRLTIGQEGTVCFCPSCNDMPICNRWYDLYLKSVSD